MSENESENENDNDNDNNNDNNNDVNDNDVNDDDDDDKDEDYYIIKQSNNYFKTTDETKSFEEQREILKKEIFYMNIGIWDMIMMIKNLTSLKIFKAKTAYILNDLDEQLFEKIFGHTFEALADKLTNTTNKEEKQILIKDIKESRDKIYEQDDFSNFVIQPGYKRGDLLDAVKIIINFNEVLSLDLT